MGTPRIAWLHIKPDVAAAGGATGHCCACGLDKPLTREFFRWASERRGGVWMSACLACLAERERAAYATNRATQLERQKSRYREDPEYREKVKEAAKERRRRDPERARAQRRGYHERRKKDPEYQEQIQAAQARHRRDHPDLVRAARRRRYHRRKHDPMFRLRKALGDGVRLGLKARGGSKQGVSCFARLPYDPLALRAHMERLFEPWMNWDNYGVYSPSTWDDADESTWVWQLDHIRPHSEFRYQTMDDPGFREAWALSNLRPLSAKQNVLEGARKCA